MIQGRYHGASLVATQTIKAPENLFSPGKNDSIGALIRFSDDAPCSDMLHPEHYDQGMNDHEGRHISDRYRLREAGIYSVAAMLAITIPFGFKVYWLSGSIVHAATDLDLLHARPVAQLGGMVESSDGKYSLQIAGMLRAYRFDWLAVRVWALRLRPDVSSPTQVTAVQVTAISTFQIARIV